MKVFGKTKTWPTKMELFCPFNRTCIYYGSRESNRDRIKKLNLYKPNYGKIFRKEKKNTKAK